QAIEQAPLPSSSLPRLGQDESGLVITVRHASIVRLNRSGGRSMPCPSSRRQFLRHALFAVPAAAVARPVRAATGPTDGMFPTQIPELVEEMVVVSHGNAARVRELLGRHPTLAKATWDWGFGDWETAVGAASHVGHREIAELLLANGAHPTIFSAAMLGHLDVVKAFITASP